MAAGLWARHQRRGPILPQVFRKAFASSWPELHDYADPMHDFAVRANDHPCATWKGACAIWLRHQKLLKSGLRVSTCDHLPQAERWHSSMTTAARNTSEGRAREQRLPRDPCRE